MAKYCKYCGEVIEDGKTCSCQMAQDALKNGKKDISDNTEKIAENFGIPNKENRSKLYERGMKIVPDCVVANDREIPLRQYDIAKLRSIGKGAFAEGRLQVTNKRVLFRAAGFSLLGPNQMQYEFAINEIAGIEIRNDHRVGVLHLLLGLILSVVVIERAQSVFEKFANFSSFLAGIIALVLAAWAVLFFLSTKGKQFIKLAFIAIAAGALNVKALTTKLMIIPVLKDNFFGFVELIIYLLLVLNLILIVYVPNLVLLIKTKGASAPIEIRRKESNGLLAFLLHMPKKEYTGYSDVMPGKDVYKAMKELGTMITEINLLGDSAIEKWKEN